MGLSLKNPFRVREDGVAEVFLLDRRGGVRAVALVDALDLPAIAPYRWRLLVAGGNHYALGRAHEGEQERNAYMHRVLAGEEGLDVDHVDGDGLNNRRNNLRSATRSQNLQNRKGAVPGSRSKYRGVDFHRASNLWRARAHLKGKLVWWAYFKTEDEAGAAAAEWRKEHAPFSREARDPVPALLPLRWKGGAR